MNGLQELGMGFGRKRGKLLWGESSDWKRGILGDWFGSLYNANGRWCSEQVRIQGFSSEHHTTLRVSKRWASIHLQEVLGNFLAETVGQSNQLRWLYTLVSPWCTWYLEWTALSTPSINRAGSCWMSLMWIMEHTLQFWMNELVWSCKLFCFLL